MHSENTCIPVAFPICFMRYDKIFWDKSTHRIENDIYSRLYNKEEVWNRYCPLFHDRKYSWDQCRWCVRSGRALLLPPCPVNTVLPLWHSTSRTSARLPSRTGVARDVRHSHGNTANWKVTSTNLWYAGNAPSCLQGSRNFHACTGLKIILPVFPLTIHRARL